MDINDNTQHTRTFSVNYVDIAGDLATGIMLSQIVAWFDAGESDEGIFETTSEDWWEACRMRPQQAHRCLNGLEGKGIISISIINRRAKLSDGNYYQSFVFNANRLRELMELYRAARTCGGADEGRNSNGARLSGGYRKATNSI